MSSLINTKIQDTYTGLIKTTDNLPVDGTLKNLEDGNGGVLPIKVSSTAIEFTGDVIGITSGGIQDGTGTDSMASILTSGPATASDTEALAIGKSANASSFNTNAIGSSASATQPFAQAFGTYCEASGLYAVSLGTGNTASGEFALAVGKQSTAPGAKSISIGAENQAQGQFGIAIGHQTQTSFYNYNIGIGYQADPNYVDSIAIGKQAEAGTGNKSDAIAIGRSAKALETDAIALGQGVQATTANTVTIKKLQMLDYATLDFADDAAAATGGIPLGGVYHTSGTLKIRIA